MDAETTPVACQFDGHQFTVLEDDDGMPMCSRCGLALAVEPDSQPNDEGDQS